MIKLMRLSLLPKTSELSKFQREEYARLWFDLAKLSAASLIVKGFEPGGPSVDWRLLITFTGGLVVFLGCVKIGLAIGKGVKS